MSVEEELVKYKQRIKDIKIYLLDAIYDIKSSYHFNVSEYKNSEVLAIYQELLNKVNELEVR